MTKSRVQAKAVDTSKLRNFVVGPVIGLAVIFGAMSLRADEAITKTHGFNFFGELKYPADYKHLDYVNPDAPKGGEISIWTMGTFDQRNRHQNVGGINGLKHRQLEDQLNHISGVSPKHDQLAMREIDHTHQTKNDRQSEGSHQEHRADGHTVEQALK